MSLVVVGRPAQLFLCSPTSDMENVENRQMLKSSRKHCEKCKGCPAEFKIIRFVHQARALRALGLFLADSALTVGRGKTFRRVNQVFFTKTAVTWELKVKKLLPKWKMNEGYKRTVDQNWGRMAKIRFFGRKPSFRAQKKRSLLNSNHAVVTTGKVDQRKKLPFPK